MRAECTACRGKKNKEMSARAFSILLGLSFLGAGQRNGAGALRSHGGPAVGGRVSDVAAGDYSAADDVNFTILPYGDKYLLRFDDSPENFVLYGDRVALGGRELKYDTGALALKISVWGGVTLYTQDAPGGLPATRHRRRHRAARLPVSAANLATALADEESHIAYVQRLKLHFSADAAILKEQR